VNNTIDNTKLAGVLKPLDKAGRLAAKRFLESPYFNSSKELLLLFKEILRLQEKNKPLDKVYLWGKIVKKNPYNDLRFRKYCSDLSKLMERFLAQQAFDEDEVQQKVFLLKKISQQEQKADKLASSAVTYSDKMMEDYPYRDTSYYLYQYLLQKSYYDLENFATKRGVKSNIEEISNYLDWFYLGEKLRLITEAESRKQLKSHEYKLSFVSEISYLTKKHFTDLENLPHIEIYYQIIQILSETEADDNYYKLKELIAKNAHFFPRDVAVDELYGAAQNYCVKKINAGERKFLIELFELFKLQIQQNILLSEGKLSPWYFRNIIVVGLRLGQYEWVEDFINKFKEYLPEDNKENAITYNMAQLYFYQKKYDKVLEQLRSVEYDDISYNLNSKTILIATYYELEELDLLDSHLDSFEVFLRRRKDFTADRKQIYSWLIKFTKRLTRIMPGDKKSLEKLKKDVNEAKGVVNASWLLEKIEELER
jgi:hypothetical protein